MFLSLPFFPPFAPAFAALNGISLLKDFLKIAVLERHALLIWNILGGINSLNSSLHKFGVPFLVLSWRCVKAITSISKRSCKVWLSVFQECGVWIQQYAGRAGLLPGADGYSHVGHLDLVSGDLQPTDALKVLSETAGRKSHFILLLFILSVDKEVEA